MDDDVRSVFTELVDDANASALTERLQMMAGEISAVFMPHCGDMVMPADELLHIVNDVVADLTGNEAIRTRHQRFVEADLVLSGDAFVVAETELSEEGGIGYEPDGESIVKRLREGGYFVCQLRMGGQ